MYRTVVAMMALLLSTIAGGPARAQQAPLAAAEIQKIKADVTTALHAYVKLLSARDVKGIAEKVFSHPSVRLDPAGIRLQTPDDVENNYRKVVEELSKTQYDHTEAKNPVVCVLSANTAIVGARFLRMNRDGSILRDAQFSYLFMKASDGWKLVTPFDMQKDKFVTCD